MGYGGTNRVTTYITNCYNKGTVISLNGENAGIIGYTFATNVVIKNVFTTKTNNIAGARYSGTITIDNGIIANNGKYTVDYMKSIDFINELNSYIQKNSNEMNECSKWQQDDKNINEGYPIFEWQ